MDFWEHTSGLRNHSLYCGAHRAVAMDEPASVFLDSKQLRHATSLCPPNGEWETRQGRRLGLTEEAAEEMFRSLSDLWLRHNEYEMNWRYSRMLRHLEKELEDREEGDLIDLADLEQIAEEAFS